VTHGRRAALVALVTAVALFVLAFALVLGRYPRLFALALPALALSLLATAHAVRGQRGAPRFYKLSMVAALLALALAR
jgi:uncharacterized membrane protein YphA (DoxX/SURF4 family)